MAMQRARALSRVRVTDGNTAFCKWSARHWYSTALTTTRQGGSCQAGGGGGLLLAGRVSYMHIHALLMMCIVMTARCTACTVHIDTACTPRSTILLLQGYPCC